MAEEIQKTKKQDMFSVDYATLFIEEGFNVRIDYGNITELASSIMAGGVVTPLVVEKVNGEERYKVISGHRRFAAIAVAIESGWEGLVPVIKEPKGTDATQRVLNLMRHNDGKQFTMYEQAVLYKRLRDEHSMSISEISKEIGKTIPHISDCLMLWDLPTELLTKVKSNQVSATLLIQEMKSGKSADTINDEVEEAANSSSSTGKVTKKNLASAGSKDKSIKLGALEDIYSEVDEALDIEIDGEKLAILKGVIDLYRQKIQFDEFVKLFKK